MTNLVGFARALEVWRYEPLTVERIAALGGVGRSAAQEWVAKLAAAGMVERAGVDARPGVKGTKPMMWRWRNERT